MLCYFWTLEARVHIIPLRPPVLVSHSLARGHISPKTHDRPSQKRKSLPLRLRGAIPLRVVCQRQWLRVEDHPSVTRTRVGRGGERERPHCGRKGRQRRVVVRKRVWIHVLPASSGFGTIKLGSQRLSPALPEIS